MMDESVELQPLKAAYRIVPAPPAPVGRTAGAGTNGISGRTEKVYFGSEGFGLALVGLFEGAAAGMANEHTRRDAEKFVSAFRAFASRGEGVSRVDSALVAGFREYLADRGHTSSYIAKRLQNFRSLYRRLSREGRVEAAPAGSFDIVGSDHPAGNRSARKSAGVGDLLAALGRLARARIVDPRLAASRDALVGAILSGGSVEGVDAARLSADAPLLLRGCGLRSAAEFGPRLAAELWIRAARECGVSAREIAAVCPLVPDGFAESLMRADASGVDRTAVLRRVSAAVLGDEPAWYALRLRPGNGSEDVRRLLAADDRLADVAPYAPVERLVARRGKRLRAIVVDRIRRVMFLYAAPAVMPLAARAVAPAASVYRQTRAADSPFARIPRWEMANFRILLDNASMADDMELVDAAERAAFRPGADVEVTDGPFAGYRGRVVSLGGDRRHLSVAITSDFGLRVTASIPDLFLRPIQSLVI